MWASPVIPHQITCPSKTFLNRHAKRYEPVPYFSSDYLLLQAIFEPTPQVLWSSPVITHQINCPSNIFWNSHAKHCEPVPSFFIRLPAPPGHFRTNMPSAVRQYHRSSSYYLPLQAIFEPTYQVLWSSSAIFIRFTAPPSHFVTNTPSTVSQSRHFLSKSSFINYFSVLKHIFSASDNASSDVFLASCWEITNYKAFFCVLARNPYRAFLWGDICVL